MAVTVVDKKIQMTAATDEFAGPIVIKTIRWTGATTAGHELRIHQSSIGTTTKEIFRSVAGGANNVEETLKELYFPFGVRIDVIQSGIVDFYFE